MLGIAPEDEYGLYEDPVEFTGTCVAANGIMLVPNDPYRTNLVLGFVSGGANAIFNQSFTDNAHGILMTTTQSFATFNFNNDGRLTQTLWFAHGAAGVLVYAISVSLKRPVRLSGYTDIWKERGPSPGAQGTYTGGNGTSLGRYRRSLPPALLSALRNRAPLIFGEG